MNLETVLDLLAIQLGANSAELIAYAAEDTLGGYHVNPAFRKWDVGSLWESEGKLLYALVRYLKPELIVEIGSLWGCSSAHLALACKVNGKGSVVSVDSNEHGIEVGNAIPADLRPYIQQVNARGEEWLARQEPGSGIGLVFEDADHTTMTTEAVSRLALNVLEPGGVLVNHDAMHDLAILGDGNRVPVGEGQAIRLGLERAKAEYRTYITSESDCGVAVTVKPKPYAHIVDDEPLAKEEIETPDGDVLEVVEAPEVQNVQALVSEAENISAPPEKKKRAPRKAKKSA